MMSLNLKPRSLRTPVVLGGLLLVLTAPAHAETYPRCERQPTQEDIEGAKGAHKAAQRFYDKGQYEEAIRMWMDAYRFDCTAHPLLLNIGNAYEKMGDKPKAIEAFENYLQRMGSGADPTIPDKVANLKEQLARQQAKPPASAATASVAATASPPPPPPPGTTAAGGPGPYPWVLVGAGAAVAVVGVVLLAVGQNKMSTAQDNCPDRVCPNPDTEGFEALGNTGRSMTGVGAVMIPVGVLAAGGGLLWYFLAPSDSSATEAPSASAQVHVRPWVSPWTSGLSVSGNF
jgi:hypothetical protein